MRPVLGVMLKVLSALVFTGMVVIIKVVGVRIPVGETLFARTFFGLFPVLALVAARGQLRTALKTERLLGHFFRSVIGVCAMSFWFASLSYLPLPDATAISYSAPLMTVVFAAILLGEKVHAYRWTSVIIGFGGMLLIMSPHLGDFGGDGGTSAQLGVFFAVGAALCMSLAMIFVRSLTQVGEDTGTIVIYFTATAALLSLLTLPFGWAMPSPEDAALLALMGLLGGIGQILLTESYRYADASTIAPFDYTTLIWALIVGWLMFSEVPDWPVFAGSAIVIAAGLFVIYREHQLGIDRKAARQARTPSRA